jgi:hypothetical protein
MCVCAQTSPSSGAITSLSSALEITLDISDRARNLLLDASRNFSERLKRRHLPGWHQLAFSSTALIAQVDSEYVLRVRVTFLNFATTRRDQLAFGEIRGESK